MKNAPTNKVGQKRRMRIILSIVLCFSIWTGYTIYLQSAVLAEKEKQLQEFQQQSAEVQQTQTELNYKITRLQDKEYIAELARKHYNLSKPGEIIFVIPD